MHFSQWSRGLSLARGEFVWIAEADDSCAPNFLERLVALAKRNPSAGFVYSQSRIINERGRTLEETPRYLSQIDSLRWQQDYFARGTDEVSNYLILRNTVPNASACLFRCAALHGDRLGGDAAATVRRLAGLCANPSAARHRLSRYTAEFPSAAWENAAGVERSR